MKKMKRVPLFLAACLFWPGLAQSSAKKDIQKLSDQVGVPLESYPAAPPPNIEEKVRQLLAQPLTVEAAVQVAVLNNRRIQATLQELGIARADLREGRTLPNPEVEASLRRNDDTHTEFAVLADVYGFLFYPLKRGLANAQYRRARLQLLDELLKQITEVKASYFRLQAVLQTRAMLDSIMESAEVAAELSTRQRNAGNIPRLEHSLQEALLQETRLAIRRADAELQAERERMGRLLGVSSRDWKLPESLPDLPGGDPPLENLEKAALTRPDVAAAREDETAKDRALTLSRLRLFPALKAGVFTEKDQDDRRLTGPALEVEIPLFDGGTAARARAKAERDQARHRAAALQNEAISEVRTILAELTAARDAAERYRDEIVPLRERIVEGTQKHYNYMLVGVYQLLEARRQEIQARRDYIETLKDYWIALAELERATGGRLSTSIQKSETESSKEPKAEPQTPEEEPTPGQHHHNHGGKQ